MLLKENLAHLHISLKNKKQHLKQHTVYHYLDFTLYRAIYCCIMIHQRQYVDTSTHCIVASLTSRHMVVCRAA